MELKEAIRILNWNQSQMRLGNLPDYSQNVYQSIETVLQELDRLQELSKDLRNLYNTYFDAYQKMLEIYEIDTRVLQEHLDKENTKVIELQKENEELKHAVVGIDLDNTYISKDEIRKMKANIQMIANGNKVIENTIKYRVQMALLDDLLKEE